MSKTISVSLDSEVKRRLEVLAEQSHRSPSLLAAEAIATYVEREEGQLEEIRVGLRELDASEYVSHDRVSAWLLSWGTAGERKPPE